MPAPTLDPRGPFELDAGRVTVAPAGDGRAFLGFAAETHGGRGDVGYDSPLRRSRERP